ALRRLRARGAVGRRDVHLRRAPSAAPPAGRTVDEPARLARGEGGRAPGAVRLRGRLPRDRPRSRRHVRVLHRARDRHGHRAHPHPLGPGGVRRRRLGRGRAAGRHPGQPRLHLAVRAVLELRRGRRPARGGTPRLGHAVLGRGRHQSQRDRRGRHRRHAPLRGPGIRLERPARDRRHPVDLERPHAAQPRLLDPLHDHGRRAAARRHHRLDRAPLARRPRAGLTPTRQEDAMPDDEVRSPAPGRARQTEVFRAGASGARPAVPTSWPALVAAAERAMSPDAWAYVAGSAGRESTAEANYDAFDAWRLVPRMLRDVSERDLGVELFGRRHPTPLFTCPIGVLELVDPDADLAIARAAGSLGITSVMSNQASQPMEHIAQDGAGPWWFQLYWSSEDALVESLVARAETAGAEAIVVTLDTGMLGWRPRDLDRGFLPFIRGMGIAQYTSDPVFRGLVRERMARPASGPRPRVTPAAVRTLLELTRRHPGSFRANLRSGEPRAA